MTAKDRLLAIETVEQLQGVYRQEAAQLALAAQAEPSFRERTTLENRAAACVATVERLEQVRRELVPRRRTRRPARS